MNQQGKRGGGGGKRRKGNGGGGGKTGGVSRGGVVKRVKGRGDRPATKSVSCGTSEEREEPTSTSSSGGGSVSEQARRFPKLTESQLRNLVAIKVEPIVEVGPIDLGEYAGPSGSGDNNGNQDSVSAQDYDSDDSDTQLWPKTMKMNREEEDNEEDKMSIIVESGSEDDYSTEPEDDSE